MTVKTTCHCLVCSSGLIRNLQYHRGVYTFIIIVPTFSAFFCILYKTWIYYIKIISSKAGIYMYTSLQYERTLIIKEDRKPFRAYFVLRSQTDCKIATYGQWNFSMTVKINFCIGLIVMRYIEVMYIVWFYICLVKVSKWSIYSQGLLIISVWANIKSRNRCKLYLSYTIWFNYETFITPPQMI